MAFVSLTVSGRSSFEVGAIQQIISVSPTAATWRTVTGHTIAGTGSGLSQSGNRVTGQFSNVTVSDGRGEILNVSGVNVQGSILSARFLTDVFTTGVDTVIGTPGSDIIFGGSGADSVAGGAGNDVVYGGTPFETSDAMSIKRLYWTLFSRQPDEPGWRGWINAMDAGQGIGGVAEGFLIAPEARFYAPASNESFVRGVYGNAIRYNPSLAEIQPWVDLLDSGARRAEVLVGIAQSAGVRARFDTPGYVEYAYQAMRGFLGREPDAAGFSGWLEYLERVGRKDAMAVHLMFSTEFIQKMETSATGKRS